MAADILLKNGMLLRGNKLVLNKMLPEGRLKGAAGLKQVIDADSEPSHIARLDNGWQMFYYPVLQEQPNATIPPTPVAVPFKIVFDVVRRTDTPEVVPVATGDDA